MLNDINNTVTTSVKAGASASSFLATNLVIFTDNTYMYLAITGAVVSSLGVLHELFGKTGVDYSAKKIIAEVIKGFILGVLAIPFWFLVITEGVLGNIVGFNIGDVSSSLALIISFALSWYTVPIFDWMVSKVKIKANK